MKVSHVVDLSVKNISEDIWKHIGILVISSMPPFFLNSVHIKELGLMRKNELIFSEGFR